MIDYLIDNGKVSGGVADMLVMEELTDKYGWTPDEIDRQDPEVLLAYMAIRSGHAEANKTYLDRKSKKEFRGIR